MVEFPQCVSGIFLESTETRLEQAVYLNHGVRFRMFPSAWAAGRRLNEAGLAVIVIGNPSVEACDYSPDSLVQQVKERGQRKLHAAGAPVDAVENCPHRPGDGRAVDGDLRRAG